jgi:hypothetical protein
MSGKIFIVFTLLVLVACGGRIVTLVEPENDETLIVVGSIILQNNGYTPGADVYMDGIDVMITSKIMVNGEEKIKDYWVVTDQNGYFQLSNVPAGNYALKAIKTTVGVQRLVTIANSLRYSGAEFQIQSRENIPFGAEYFEEKVVGRVVDLKHNFFLIDYASQSNYRVQVRKANLVPKAVLVNGAEMTRPSVPEYFIQKFPESKWTPILKQISY